MKTVYSPKEKPEIEPMPHINPAKPVVPEIVPTPDKPSPQPDLPETEPVHMPEITPSPETKITQKSFKIMTAFIHPKEIPGPFLSSLKK